METWIFSLVKKFERKTEKRQPVVVEPILFSRIQVNLLHHDVRGEPHGDAPLPRQPEHDHLMKKH